MKVLRTLLISLIALALMAPPSAAADGPMFNGYTLVPPELSYRNGGHYGALATDGERYLFVDSDGRIFRSEDGLAWDHYEDRRGRISSSPQRLLWDGQQWVLLTDSHLYTSPDGVTWTDKTPKPADTGMAYEFQDMLFVNGTYYIVAYEFEAPDPHASFYAITEAKNRMLISRDLASYRLGTVETSLEKAWGMDDPLSPIAYGAGVFAGNNGNSTDGEHWSGHGAYGCANIIWDGNRFLCARMDFIRWRAASGEWQFQKLDLDVPGAPAGVKLIGYNGQEYLVVGLGSTQREGDLFVMSSTDGMTFSPQWVPGVYNRPETILPTPQGFLLGGNGLVYVSRYQRNEPSQWAVPSIEEARKVGLVPEKLLSFYQAPVTRRETAELTVRLYTALTGREPAPVQTNPFKDTTSKAVLQAKSLGVVSGTAADLFTPDAPVTRQDLAVMIGRTLKAAGVTLEDGKAGWAGAYSDAAEAAPYAASALEQLNRAGIISGQGAQRLAPRGKTTREEAMVLMLRTFQKIKR